MKKVLFVLALLAAAGCDALQPDEPFVIKNACAGVWIIVVDGEGNVLAPHLNPGGVVQTEVEGWRGSTVRLLASGYEVGSNRDMGTAQTTRTVPRWSSSTGPSQVPPWDISSLSSSGIVNGGCKK
jgi:hypothetical protein